MCWKFTPWVKFYFGLSLHIFLWQMRASPGACIKPGCLARRPLCHKVNLPASCEAQRLLCHKVHYTELCSSAAVILQSKSTEMWSSAAAVIPQSTSTEVWSSAVPFMTCGIFGTGQTNILARQVQNWNLPSCVAQLWSAAAPFHLYVWYFWHWINEHFS